MISRLISWLEQANLDLGDEDIADAIWLAMQMGVSQPTIDSENDASDSTTQSQTIVIEEDTQDVSSLPEFSFSAFPADAVNRPPQESTVASEGLPFQAPAAVALQNALELGRSLRPLMRKVPSPTRLVLDEEATVNSIIEQQIWQPVLMPAPERWLDLELVVEASPLSHIWQQTIADFQYKVLERQGAFRNVRAWTLQNTGQNRPCLVTRNVGDTSPRIAKPEELVHPSGRRLVMLISDCRSDLWQQAPPVNRPNVSDSRLSNIYCWLSYWANHGPVLLIQLLPDWLWERSALGCGFEACLSSLTPAVANALFDVQGLSQRSRDRADVANALKLLVTTLDADLLLQCAEVIAGAGEVQAAGVIFNLSRLPGLIQANQSGSEVSRSAETNEERAERLVDTFLA
ncbi:MAG TPA: SAV_2336 N-terminal domain-related protein, partial [Allocoleopsis sp.]